MYWNVMLLLLLLFAKWQLLYSKGGQFFSSAGRIWNFFGPLANHIILTLYGTKCSAGRIQGFSGPYLAHGPDFAHPWFKRMLGHTKFWFKLANHWIVTKLKTTSVRRLSLSFIQKFQDSYFFYYLHFISCKFFSK